MKKIIQEFHVEFDFDFEEINIESDRKLFDKYKEKIPVLHCNGRMFAKYKIDERKLRKKLISKISQ